MLPLPDTGISRVIGLLEVLHDHGNEDETGNLANELKLNVETLLPVVEAGELLGFIHVSGGRIKLTDSGLKAVNSKIIERKAVVKEKIMALEPFKRVLELLKGRKNMRMPKKALQKTFREELPKEAADRTLARIIDWGRHAGLIGYDSDTDELYLQEKGK